MLPNKNQLARIRAISQNWSERLQERRGKIHYGCFLLCFGAGLRVSEAVGFDYQKRVNGLYVVKSKRERYVAVNDKIVSELKVNNWQPGKTNRFNFARYCRKLKKEAGIAAEVELTPHTGRRAWATYQAENGVPLPLLAKMLGHRSKKTTAEYYWHNTYQGSEGENILFGQKLTKFDILKKIKDRKFWREYNRGRKEYFQKYYRKKKILESVGLNKGVKRVLKKESDKNLQYGFTIGRDKEKLENYQEEYMPKSRLEITG